MSPSNFTFLASRWPTLAQLGELAEKNLHADPNTSLIKLRMFGEILSKIILSYENLEEPYDGKQTTRLSLIKSDGALPDRLIGMFHSIRKAGNKATHEAYGTVQEATTQMTFAYRLAVWFVQTYDNWTFNPSPFKEPEKLQDIHELQDLLRRKTENFEAELARLQEELAQQKAAAVLTEEEKSKRHDRAQKAAAKIKLSEAETRKLIDQQLQAAGWEADTQNLRWSKGTRPEKNRNLAIAEWPTEAGPADYALFAGLEIIGLVEAKKKSKDVVADMEQVKNYAKHITQRADEIIPGTLGSYKVPFLFTTNSRPYLKQLETKSGVWLLDARKKTNHPRPLQAWYTPQGLKELLKQNIDLATEKLHREPYDYLNLRDYQVAAIKTVEKALSEEQLNILIAMATGTGKTRTTIGLVYRLIKLDRFKRILFLVDRSALGEQAEDAFKEARLEDFHTFTQIFDLKGLADKTPETTTKVHIATVQGMVRRIMFGGDDADTPTVDRYDCIVVDEAHRGYILDKEMDDVELEFRDQKDYISKFRMVLEYFDAVKIGLTATPAPHTIEIFGKPVFTYSYRDAVIDGWLVDHEPPHQIGTKLKETGIKWKKGEKVPIYDSATGQITNSEELPDELSLDIDKFNRAVITENFNKTVIKELAKELDHEGEEKTLVFAATDDHADMVVRLMKQEFEEQSGTIDDDAITKITGSIKDPVGMIRRYKNERLPNIAVTVDLLTTGIDVPEICNLVFLRRVRSRILYEQMLGRATRLCPRINKTHFVIYDPVGLYEALAPVTNMKPVVANPRVDFTTLVKELQELEDEAQQKVHVEQIVAKLQRKKRRLKGQDKEDFITLAGGRSPEDFINWLGSAPVAEIKEELQKRTNLFSFLDENRYQPRQQLISFHEDELVYHTRGYGNAEKPEDYLDEFTRFIKDNMNIIPALQIVCQRPRELTRQALRELKLELDRHGYSETSLRTAWREMTNQDIAADIIGFIRQRALGDPLLSHEERIKNAMQKVYALQKWTNVQRKWLERIEKQLIKETVINPEDLDKEPFRETGGYKKINKIFNGQIDQVLNQIKKSLYPDERKQA
ncbi:type I restriction-modification system endonuclease [Desulfoscipio sp. XC116]|uniref:type I restriction-modification system endonuclease n=1 Tax=Desulfoscipio sp. XC116 TaxID=3144975 RepID=UPI00325A44FF